MIFQDVGKGNGPVIIMLNGSFCTGNGLTGIAKALSEDYRIILPTYDGHYEGSRDFTTREDQAEKVLEHLHSEGIREVDILIGISMGAEIAMDLFAKSLQSGLTVHGALLDGGPFLSFPSPIRALLRMKFKSIVNMLRGKGEASVTEFLNSKIARWLIGENPEDYTGMLEDMYGVCQNLTDTSVRREADACLTFDYPPIPKDEQEKLLFNWSDNEPAGRFSKGKMMKLYPYAKYHFSGNLGHCGLLVRKPNDFVRLVLKHIDNTNINK